MKQVVRPSNDKGHRDDVSITFDRLQRCTSGYTVMVYIIFIYF
jgi:hypothetical protein